MNTDRDVELVLRFESFCIDIEHVSSLLGTFSNDLLVLGFLSFSFSFFLLAVCLLPRALPFLSFLSVLFV